jgi:hypothetical protein
VNNSPKPQRDTLKARREGQEYLARVYAKMSQLVEDFAQGKVNRAQFHQLYTHYERQITTIGQMLAESRQPEEWRSVASEGESILIRQQHQAHAVGFAIYDNASGMPIETLGEFTLDTALIIPLLSSYRSAAAEIFRAGMRNTELENGQWLCFVPGQHTTLLSVFTLEPAEQQLRVLERMHQHFEQANKDALASGRADPATLALPFLSILKQAKRDQ